MRALVVARGRLALPVRYLMTACLLALATPLCQAQSAPAWPTRPIHWILPYGPGASDILGRILAQRVSTTIGQQVLVENRPSAGGSVATEMVARAAPDGYTLLMGAAVTHAVNPALLPRLGYDPQRDFTPVIMLASIPNILVVHPSVQARTVQDLIALAKAQPGAIMYSSNGPGTSPHMATALFALLTNTELTHVPYKGGAEAVIAVARGDVQMMFASLAPAQPLIRDNRVRMLGVAMAQRLPSFPDWPTLAEAGVADFQVPTWFGLFAPAGTPEAVVQRLNREYGAALAEPAVRDRLLEQGFIIDGGSPQDLTRLVASERERWTRVVKASGMKVE